MWPFKTFTNELHASLPQFQAQILRQYDFLIQNISLPEINNKSEALSWEKNEDENMYTNYFCC